MKLGYLTRFTEDELRLAASIGYDGLEVHAKSWPPEVFTSEVERKKAVEVAKELQSRYGVTVTAVSFYDATYKPPVERIADFRKVIQFTSDLGVPVVAAMSAGDPEKSLEENIPIFKETFGEIAKICEDMGVKIAFENWPAVSGLPAKSKNFGFHPTAWELMFDAVDSPALGLEFDPSHLVWQSIDYIAAVKAFGARIHHVHLKDTEIMHDVLACKGFFGRGWWRYRIPGFGVIDWAGFVSALREVGYNGGAAIEHEDPVFSGERRVEGLKLGYNCLRPLFVVD